MHACNTCTFIYLSYLQPSSSSARLFLKWDRNRFHTPWALDNITRRSSVEKGKKPTTVCINFLPLKRNLTSSLHSDKLKFDKRHTQHRAPAGFIDAQTAVLTSTHIRDLRSQSTTHGVVCFKRAEVHDELTEGGNRHKVSKCLQVFFLTCYQ